MPESGPVAGRFLFCASSPTESPWRPPRRRSAVRADPNAAVPHGRRTGTLDPSTSPGGSCFERGGSSSGVLGHRSPITRRRPTGHSNVHPSGLRQHSKYIPTVVWCSLVSQPAPPCGGTIRPRDAAARRPLRAASDETGGSPRFSVPLEAAAVAPGAGPAAETSAASPGSPPLRAGVRSCGGVASRLWLAAWRT